MTPSTYTELLNAARAALEGVIAATAIMAADPAAPADTCRARLDTVFALITRAAGRAHEATAADRPHLVALARRWAEWSATVGIDVPPSVAAILETP